MKNIHSIQQSKLFLDFGLQWSLKEFLRNFGVLIEKNEIFNVFKTNIHTYNTQNTLKEQPVLLF